MLMVGREEGAGKEEGLRFGVKASQKLISLVCSCFLSSTCMHSSLLVRQISSRTLLRSTQTLLLNSSRLQSSGTSSSSSLPLLLHHFRPMSSPSTLPPAADAPAVQGVAPDAPPPNPLDPATAVDKVTEKLSKVKIPSEKKEKVKKEKVAAAPPTKLNVSRVLLSISLELAWLYMVFSLVSDFESQQGG